MMHLNSRYWLALLVVHVCAGWAFSDTFTYTAQSRSVYVNVGAIGIATPSQTIVAPDFGIFDETASVSMPSGGPSGFATQHQRSTLGADGIKISGEFTGSHPSYAGTGYARGSSLTDVTFTLAEPTGMYLGVTLERSSNDYDAFSNPLVRLSTPGSSFPHVVSLDPSSMPYASVKDLLLPAGTYTLHVNLQAYLSSHSFDDRPAYNIILAVPEPAAALLLAPCLMMFLSGRRRLRS